MWTMAAGSKRERQRKAGSRGPGGYMCTMKVGVCVCGLSLVTPLRTVCSLAAKEESRLAWVKHDEEES